MQFRFELKVWFLIVGVDCNPPPRCFWRKKKRKICLNKTNEKTKIWVTSICSGPSVKLKTQSTLRCQVTFGMDCRHLSSVSEIRTSSSQTSCKLHFKANLQQQSHGLFWERWICYWGYKVFIDCFILPQLVYFIF